MKTFKDITFKPHKVGKGAIQGLNLAVEKKFITMGQAFEIIRDVNVPESGDNKSIGFNQKR